MRPRAVPIRAYVGSVIAGLFAAAAVGSIVVGAGVSSPRDGIGGPIGGEPADRFEIAFDPTALTGDTNAADSTALVAGVSVTAPASTALGAPTADPTTAPPTVETSAAVPPSVESTTTLAAIGSPTTTPAPGVAPTIEEVAAVPAIIPVGACTPTRAMLIVRASNVTTATAAWSTATASGTLSLVGEPGSWAASIDARSLAGIGATSDTLTVTVQVWGPAGSATKTTAAAQLTPC